MKPDPEASASQIESIMTIGPVIPVMVIEHLDDAVPLARALVNGGLKVLEITLRTACALDAITKIKNNVPDAIVGAGTILTPKDLNLAISAGSEFLVSPGYTPSLIEAALSEDVPILPGVATPSEAMQLAEYGISHMKFFPAEAAGGIKMLQSIGSPLPHLKFCPTGGITAQNAQNYLALNNVLCVGGTWMMQKSQIQQKDWHGIELLARQATSTQYA